MPRDEARVADTRAWLKKASTDLEAGRYELPNPALAADVTFHAQQAAEKAFKAFLAWHDVPGYLLAQVLGALVGVAAANLMFGLPIFFASSHARPGAAQLFSEFVATFGLLAAIWGCVRLRPAAVPFAVAAYITAAYWFTASTSFANPSVTLARSLSDTFAGIRPADVPGFVAAQIAGAAAATLTFRWLVPASRRERASRAPAIAAVADGITTRTIRRSARTTRRHVRAHRQICPPTENRESAR